MKKAIMSITEDDRCCGCAVCESVCTHGAIKIKNDEGFYRPYVDAGKCVGCGLCKSICPVNNCDEIKNFCYETPEFAYAAWNNNDELHYHSASGGIVSSIAIEFIYQKAFVCCAYFNPETQIVEHTIFRDLNELKLARGSKYVNSNKSLIYEKVLEELKYSNGLFIGVPCEVYAMRKYLQKKDHLNKLYFIDLLCHGGASPLCFDEHIKYLAKRSLLSNVTFRGGDYDCRISLFNGNKLIYQDGQFDDVYFKLFMRHTLYQPACFACNFAGSNRVGDITAGDFWGLADEIEAKNHLQGCNMILINNADGNVLFDLIKDRITYYKRNVSEAINGNSTLYESTKKEAEYDEFWKAIREVGFHKAVKKIYGINVKKRYIYAKLKLEVKRIIGHL